MNPKVRGTTYWSIYKIKKTNANNIWCSQAVTHPSTNQTRRCLTSLIGREAVLSTWYGRWQGTHGKLLVWTGHHGLLSWLLDIADVIIATLYQPPAWQYIPIPDFIRLFRTRQPVNMIADLNANHPTLGYRTTNTKGRHIHTLINNRTLQHIGPHFPTYLAHNTRTTPDIILTNFRTHTSHNNPWPPVTTFP